MGFSLRDIKKWGLLKRGSATAADVGAIPATMTGLQTVVNGAQPAELATLQASVSNGRIGSVAAVIPESYRKYAAPVDLLVTGSSISTLVAYGGTVNAAELYGYRLQQYAISHGLSYLNAGVVGGCFNNFWTTNFVNRIVVPGSITTMELGYNNLRIFGSAPRVVSDYGVAAKAMIAWAAIPESDKIRPVTIDGSVNPYVTTTGPWAGWTIASSRYCYGASATMTATVTGHSVLIFYGRKKGVTSGFNVAIDGEHMRVINATMSYTPNSQASPANGVDFETAVEIITGLSDAEHTIVLTLINGTLGVVVGFGGISASTRSATVLVGNTLRMTDAGYAVEFFANDPTSSTAPGNYGLGAGGCEAVNRQLARDIAQLQCIGLNVVPVDISRQYDPYAGVDTDNVHPSKSGHWAIYGEYKRTLDALLAIS